MTAKRIFSTATAIAVLAGSGVSGAAGSISIRTVLVGNPGSPGDSRGDGYVASLYRIGATEVTNAQYASFLNAVAANDLHSLYNDGMGGIRGGITRTGLPGSYSYATISGRANHPVNFVSFWDTLRFANWLHNGQPVGAQSSGTTEGGAYTLTSEGIVNNTVVRNSNWKWAVPSQNEWHKAAYHQPAASGGDSDSFWLYPTASNTAPSANQANFGNFIGDTTPVGSYASNFYGAVDLGGNVAEWTEQLVTTSSGVSARAIRGGAFGQNIVFLRSNFLITGTPANESSSNGFRVVNIPVPSTVALLAIGGVMVGRRRR